MSDPKRLLDLGIGADLLSSARGDAPSHAARRRTAIALGIAAGASVTTTATTAAAVSKWGVYGSAAALLKWIGIGALGGFLTIGAVEVVTGGTTLGARTEPANAANPVSTAAAERTPRAATPLPPSRPPTPDTAVVPLPAASAASLALPAQPGASAPAYTAPAASSATLADEVRALDRARNALAGGDTRGALDALDAHDRAFAPRAAALAPEAAVLRIEALAQRGDDAAATARANAFLAAYPDSAQARRVRSVLLEIAKKKNP